MADFTNKIESSTAMLGHFVYRGTYETYLGIYLGVVAPDKYEAAETDVANAALEIIAGALWYVFPIEVRDDFEFKYTRTYHPSYYNFETDNVIFDFSYSDALKDWMFKYAEDNKEQFNKFLYDNFTSRSGFISYTPNNWDVWLDGWNDGNWRCVSVLLWFIIEQEITENEIESYEYDFDDRVRTIIEEGYISCEYAEKFENGWTGVCIGEWDDDEQETVYTAYLLDTEGNIVDTATDSDPYDEYYNMSAYAAWEYGTLKFDVIKDRVKNSWKATQCEVPDIETIEVA